MAKPYRRRKGKRGPFVGNYRVTVDGRDLNLGTKDAAEALHRARLAVRGQWPPEEAAAKAASRMLDPGAGPALAAITDAPVSAPAAAAVVSGAPAAGADFEIPDAAAADASQAPPPAHPPGETLDAAAAAAAGEAAGANEEFQATRAEREHQVEGELAEIMSELSGGKGGGELVDGVCDMLAAGTLWLERKGIELGWKFSFQKYTGKRLVAGPQPDRTDISQKCLRVGFKAIAVVHFPELAAKLTPGWAIAIGLVVGGGGAIVGGRLIDVETGESTPFAEVAKQAAAAVQTPPPAAA